MCFPLIVWSKPCSLKRRLINKKKYIIKISLVLNITLKRNKKKLIWIISVTTKQTLTHCARFVMWGQRWIYLLAVFAPKFTKYIYVKNSQWECTLKLLLWNCDEVSQRCHFINKCSTHFKKSPVIPTHTWMEVKIRMPNALGIGLRT